MIEFEGHPELKMSWKIIPFFAVHAAALAVFWVPFSWGLVALCLGLYLVRMFGVTAGYHRYFSHRTFKTSRAFQLVLAILGLICFQKGPLWWAHHHRHHHRHSDRHGDLHSPGLQGFLWAHVGWILTTQHDETDYRRIADFARYRELVWLNENHLVPGLALGAVLFLAGGLPALVWGLFASTVMTWHATFAINSLTHMFGKRRYATKDGSRNNWLLALVCLGEGWHNNHHYYKSATRQGFYWWEIDLTYYVLRLLALAGIVWDLKEPSETIKNGNRIDRPSPADPEAERRQAAA